MTEDAASAEGRAGRPMFIDEVRRRTQARFPDQDFDATAAGLALTRAAHAHEVLSEKYVHRRNKRSWLSFRLLYVLWVFAPISARDLVEVLQVSRQTISTILRGLEVGGLINRTVPPHDARLFTLELTQAGRRSVEDSIARQFRIDQNGFGVLSADEQRQLIDLLDRVRAGMVELMAEGVELDLEADAELRKSG
ncbi:MAG TPA: MarR family transcriptional regulator [Aldersonia sp.]